MKKMLCLVLTLLTVLSLFAFANADSALDKALGYFEKGQYKKAEKIFIELGQEGNLTACVCLANIYKNNLTGKGSENDYNYWNKRANKIMDDLYSDTHTLSDKKDYSGAVKILKELAAFDHVKSLNDLAVYYKEGKGVTKDLKMAYECLMRAAELNHPTSIYNLGVFYEKGYYVEKDLKTALTYFEKAEEMNYKNAPAAVERVKKALDNNGYNCATCKDGRVCYMCKGTRKSLGVTCVACEGTGRCPHCTVIIPDNRCGACNGTRRCGGCAGMTNIMRSYGITCSLCNNTRICKYCR